jgi:ABC-type dipeptide/oligopeptide/nickel transport system permease subunit
VIPNVMSPIIVQSSLQMAVAILFAAGLGFLGLGARPPQPEWGLMLARGREYLAVAPHVATFPGLAIVLVVLGFNLLGDALRDALDPALYAAARDVRVATPFAAHLRTSPGRVGDRAARRRAGSTRAR